jgi:hypothetical protein
MAWCGGRDGALDVREGSVGSGWGIGVYWSFCSSLGAPSQNDSYSGTEGVWPRSAVLISRLKNTVD